MAGLLDIITGGWTDDPNQNAAIRQGLLAGAFGAMAGRGSRMQALGQGGLSGLLGYANTLNAQDQRAKDAQLMAQRELELQSARDQMARQRAMQALPEQFYRSPAQEALSGGGGPTVENARQLEAAKPGFDYQGYAQALAQFDPAASLAMQNSMRRDATPIKLGAGEKLLDPRSYQSLAENPRADNQSSLGQLISEMQSLPAGDPRRDIYMQAIRKASTHSPAVNVSYGQPVAGVDAKGNPVFFQPDKGGGAPAIVPNVKPAPQNRDTKLPAELQRMQIAGDTMEQLLGEYETLLRKHNPRDPLTQMNPAVRADMQAVKRNMELQFKELQALGALAGPDVEIMRQAMADPFSAAGAYYGREGLLAQTKRARDLVKQRRQAVLRSQGQPAAEVNDDPLGLRSR